MTDVSHQPFPSAAASASRPASKSRSVMPYTLVPFALILLAGAIGLLVGRALGGNPDAFEDKLLLLLRFMAGMKLLGVLVAASILRWRLTQPTDPRLALAYNFALVPMAAAIGLIWSLGAIALGALLFHAGLLAFLYLAWIDDGVRWINATDT